VASAVDICNMALGHLGDQAIVSSITPPDQSVQAGLCATFYPIARDAVLERHPWSFATKRAPLQVVANTDQPTSWGYSYALPAQCLVPLKVLPEGYGSDQQGLPFTVEALSSGDKVIYCNYEAPTLLFIAAVTDTTRFSMLFTIALSRLLASLLAGPRIKGTTGIKLSQAQLEFYEKVALPQARIADSNARLDNTLASHIPSSIAARS